MKNLSATKETLKEIAVRVTVNTFNENGHSKELRNHSMKLRGKKAKIAYPQIQTLVLNRKQKALFLAFTNSLLK